MSPPNRPITPLLAAFLPLTCREPNWRLEKDFYNVDCKIRFLSQILMENTLRNIQTPAEDVNKDSRFVVSVTIYIPCFVLFPTCQVRVVRFYPSCSPPLPPRLALLLLLLLLLLLRLLLFLLLQFLLDHVCINFPPSLPPCQLFPKLFANFRAQWAPLDLNLGPAQLSVHRWTSTWDLPSSVCTAGPQPGTFPAQCALLDLNLGPAQLSVHRWTSTAR